MNLSLAQQIVAAGFPEPVAEFRFHQTRKWRFDWCWPERKLAVEVDGVGFYGRLAGGGRHQRAHGYAADCEKGAEAMILGWRVLHVTQEQVKTGQALLWIEKLLKEDMPVYSLSEENN